MKKKTIMFTSLVLSGALMLSACAGPGVKSAQELRSRGERSSGYQKTSLQVDDGFREVVQRLARLSQCLNVVSTSKYYRHDYYTDLEVGTGEAQLTLQKQETEATFLVVTTTPREQGYLMVVDAIAKGDATDIDIYLPEDAERLNRAVTRHLDGTARGCPVPELLP